jgi:hypothetical protein
VNSWQRVLSISVQGQILILPGRLEQIVENILILTVDQTAADHIRSELLFILQKENRIES